MELQCNNSKITGTIVSPQPQAQASMLLEMLFVSKGLQVMTETLPWTSYFWAGFWQLCAVTFLLTIKIHSLKYDPWRPILATKSSTKPPTKSYSNATASTFKIKSNIWKVKFITLKRGVSKIKHFEH